MKNRLICFLIFLFSNFSVFAVTTTELFNTKMTLGERKKLQNGEIVIRNIDEAKNLSLKPITPVTERCVRIINELKPNYLAEIIQVFPLEKAEILPINLENALSQVDKFEFIPYYSIHNETWYDLFSKVTIVDERINEHPDKNKKYKVVNTDIQMNPFDPFSVTWTMEKSGENIFFTVANTTKIKYSGINCVSADKMKWVVALFKTDDAVILYGAGAVNGASIFFLRNRIENSFIGRITSFCNYIYSEVAK